MAAAPDFTVYSRDARPQMTVEVKYRPGASDDWAAEFRRNLLRHGIVPRAHAFLLVLAETAYLWREGASEEDEPSVKLPTEELLQSFFQSNRTRPTSGEGLELSVQGWLQTIMRLPADEVERRHPWLLESGVYDRIRGGYVDIRPAA